MPADFEGRRGSAGDCFSVERDGAGETGTAEVAEGQTVSEMMVIKMVMTELAFHCDGICRYDGGVVQ